MKKRKVKVDGQEYEVELEKQDGVWNVTIEGKSFNIEIEGSSVGDSSGSKPVSYTHLTLPTILRV